MESGATDELAGMREAERFGFRARWLLVAASAVLLIAWPPRDWLPYAVVALLVAYNLAGFFLMPRLTTVRRARASGLVSLALLNLYVAANAFSYSYLVESPGGLGFYFLPLSAALRLGMGASLPQALLAGLLDAASHYYAREHYGVPFELAALVLRTAVYAAIGAFASGWMRTVSRQRAALKAAACEQARLAAGAAERAQRFRALTTIQREITERLEPDAICSHVAQSAAQLLGADCARVWVRDQRSGALAVAAEFGPPDGARGLDDATAASAAASERALLGRGQAVGPFALCLPMRFEGEVVGVLGVAGPAAAYPGAEQVELLYALAASAAIAIENARLLEARGQAEALQRLDAMKSEFVRSISHELRTPLTLILGHAELLSVDTVSSSAARGSARQILESSELMTRLIDDLLAFAPLERGELRLHRRALDVGDLLDDVLADFGGQPGGQRLRLERAGSVEVDGDAARLTQAVAALIGNALRYAPDGPVAVRCLERPEWVRVEVADQGPGIGPEERGRVWERFYRGRGVAGAVGSRSTGLGLAVVKTLVEAHGGCVGLACPPEGGSIFWFELPRALDRSGCPSLELVTTALAMEQR